MKTQSKMHWLWTLLPTFAHAAIRALSDYGGISACTSVACAKANGEAFVRAARSAQPSDEVVVVENGNVYHYMPVQDSVLTSLVNITFTLAGTLVLHDNFTSWPRSSEDEFVNAIDIQLSSDVRFRGGGTIEGQGQAWWSAFAKGDIPRKRPTILNFDTCAHLEVENISLLNGPRFHLYGYNLSYASLHNLTIWVDDAAMSEDAQFPLNTDGIDVSGKHIRVYDVNVSNYDDRYV